MNDVSCLSQNINVLFQTSNLRVNAAPADRMATKLPHPRIRDACDSPWSFSVHALYYVGPKHQRLHRRSIQFVFRIRKTAEPLMAFPSNGQITAKPSEGRSQQWSENRVLIPFERFAQ
jgi:hypothetical protein